MTSTLIVLFLSAPGQAGAGPAVAAPGADVLPRLLPDIWTPRVGDPVTLTWDDPRTRGDEIHVVLRVFGEQRILSPNKPTQPAGGSNASGAASWTFVPARPGTHVLIARHDSTDSGGVSIVRVEKLCILVDPATPDAVAAPPSASSTARFGQDVELTPLVDPDFAPPGSDVPVQVKCEHRNLPNARVQVSTRAEAAKAAEAGKNAAPRRDAQRSRTTPATGWSSASQDTNESGIANVRISKSGIVSVGVERPIARAAVAPPPASPGAVDKTDAIATRYIGVLTFRVPQSAPGAPGSLRDEGKRP